MIASKRRVEELECQVERLKFDIEWESKYRRQLEERHERLCADFNELVRHLGLEIKDVPSVRAYRRLQAKQNVVNVRAKK